MRASEPGSDSGPGRGCVSSKEGCMGTCGIMEPMASRSVGDMSISARGGACKGLFFSAPDGTMAPGRSWASWGETGRGICTDE